MPRIRKNSFIALAFYVQLINPSTLFAGTEQYGPIRQIREVAKFVGVFKSKVWSSGFIRSSEITFFMNDSNQIVGNFWYKEESGPVKGLLSNCISNNANRKIICKWSDKYGTGVANLDFSPDYTSFKGRWNKKGSSKTYPWTGNR